MDNLEQTSKKDILVSVWMPAYFAGEYIGEAIESILAQETQYPYEIVINDDCSQDETWEVVCRYAEKYPDIIRPHRNEKNLGLSANVLATKRRCRGKYIVNLSGDDYWIDTKKIQKQADFLESHPDYIGIGSKVEIRYDDEKTAASFYPAAEELGKDFTKDSYSRGVNLPSHGFMVRNIFADESKQALIDRVYGVSSTIDDLYDPVLYLECGKIFIMAEATCAHRIPSSKKGKRNFNSVNRPLKKAMIIFDGYVGLEKLQLEGIDLSRRFSSVFDLIVLGALQERKPSCIKAAYRQIPVKYRRGLAAKSAASVWRTGFRIVKNKLKRRSARS